MKVLKYFLVALFVIAIDQASKLLVYHHMQLGEEINVIGQWFRLHYLLNPGMAFGIRWENEFGKLALTFFRMGAMVGIGYYLVSSVRKKLHPGFLICLALILGGAIGNVIDSIFYGVFLENNALGAPVKWFHGEVIDMLYFPLFHIQIPEWFPLNPGGEFEFFSPVFNIADSSIFIGVATVLIFQKKFFPHQQSGKTHDGQPASEIPVSETQTPAE
ncbi:MAG: lipoprotein signal peptidase [Bacteroidetes bacterium]|nr:lipoprotein signal peptidase [Bacteroidota bacterium]